ncbi:hypothetical protein PQJ75_02270 [Rhodoplanes sp. TEM]|uniref:EthD domain-containing protein n=1 Tax=Rhodoplanes tepidamans TaxID=200616 RepID=A0ABT5J707_RHOTP|nr:MULTISPECIES: DUF4286 family protein [Rhodoplanes]MDC7785074.1 hypothetical protein [Rhodoplanes tepidamans]MDC7982548.1 hypothetical protein [Rhodoplanes sp. TEM]MDQ0356563.1 hypothetical protein [Rhodoplanes tepidamans]
MGAIGRGILFSEMTPPEALEHTFNDWYDTEHIPVRMGAPGFRSAQRYRDGTTRNYLAVYEMDGPEALKTPEYGVIKNSPSDLTRDILGAVSGFTRYVGRTIAEAGPGGDVLLDAPVLYAVFFAVPEDRCAAFDAWYDQDHVPLLLSDPRWLGVRRFDVVDGAPEKYNRLALHYLSDRGVMESDARRRARETPWRAALAAEPWFKGHYVIFDRLGARQMAKAA